jgi:hypothetical protein
MYEAAASCEDIARTAVTNWELKCVTLAGYGYAVRHGMKVQLVTPYLVSHLQHYGVTIRGNVISVHRQHNIKIKLKKIIPAPKGYTLGFPGCYGSTSDVFKASSGFVHFYTLRFKETEKRAAVVAKATVHK